MTTNRAVRWLRVCYWIGAIIDGLFAVVMISPPAVGGKLFGIDDFHPGPEYRYAMFVGAALMAGWPALLIWADRTPLERKGVILLTVVPVICGLVGANVYAVSTGMVAVAHMLPMWIMQAGLVALFTFAYVNAGRKA